MQRNQSLDALRGYAILTMILSGSIAFGDTMPAWMYHAQEPPPTHQFIETVAGITWVDLVFPFFLFSMGAAIPLALNNNVKNKSSFLQIVGIAFRRLLLLTFFALFTQHLKAWVITAQPSAKENLISIFAFVLLFFQLYNYKGDQYKKIFFVLKIISFVIAILLLIFLKFNGNSFQFTKSDIIIIVLANMAFFGTIIWWLTKNNILLRIGILPFVMAIFLASKESGAGWAKMVYNFASVGNVNFDWLYKFYFLKYLFIVIPGTLAGDWLLADKQENIQVQSNKNLIFIALIAFAIIITNTIFLFTRDLSLNLVVTIFLISILFFLLKKHSINKNNLLYKYFTAATYLLLLGLCFEAYEGGIRKDHSTYSYYFVTSGLAFFMLISFSCINKNKTGNSINNFLALNGKNPMVAYVAGSLLLIPIMQLTGANKYFDAMNINAFVGFVKGVLFTGIVSLITIFFTKKGWFWKT